MEDKKFSGEKSIFHQFQVKNTSRRMNMVTMILMTSSDYRKVNLYFYVIVYFCIENKHIMHLTMSTIARSFVLSSAVFSAFNQLF